MTFLLADLAAFALATLAAIVLLVLPGFGLLRLVTRCGLPGLDADRGWWGLVLGISVLPAIDALLVRFGGIPIAIALHLLLALAGTRDAVTSVRATPLWGLAIAAMWWAIVAYGLADFGDASGVNQPLTVLDTVKHAAVIASISANGLPLVDPFFARDTAAGYYHYFYIGPALIDWVAGAADARAAFMAGAWSAGLSFFAMAMLVARRAGLIVGATGRYAAILALLFCVSGLDILPAIGVWLRYGLVLGQLDWWAQEVRWAAVSLVWVPHHLSALTAAMVGCLLIADASRAQLWPVGALVGAAFASAFGMSVWVTLALAPALIAWWALGAWRRKPLALALPVAAVAAALWSIPQFADLLNGRAPGSFPLAFTIRSFGGGWPTSWWMDIVLMPLSFAIEFGLFAYGSWRWWKAGLGGEATAMARLLPVLAITGLLCAGFLRSTLINNDFGWRAVWLAQLTALLWTCAWLANGGGRQVRLAVVLLGGFGLLATLVDGIGLRFIRPSTVPTTLEYINRHPRVDAGMRIAYHWANEHLPPDTVIQHNPALDERAFGFGLYSRQRSAVADGEAKLFGVDPAAVTARIATIAPAFSHPESIADTRRRLTAISADTILLTSRDPLWQRAGGPPPQWTCLYRSADVCIAQFDQPGERR